jgi:Na+/melibiose symporter-like transporter
LYKLSQSLAVFFVGTLLDVIKFDSSVVQAPIIYLKLGLILPAGFLICFTLAIVFAVKYTLTREKVTQYQMALQSRQE